MAQRVIGLDVGTSAVRAAEVALEGRPRLLRFGQVALAPEAVVDGEVVDVSAVTAALKRLWKETGFKNRQVRVGVSSARVILRVVDVPALSDADTKSALRLQLGEYVPLAVDRTVFDFQPIEHLETETGPQQRVLLAAAHEDVVRPVLDAVKRAGLRAVAVDVLPAALARAAALASRQAPPGSTGSLGAPGSLGSLVAPGSPGGEDAAPVEAIVSVGAGTVLVVVARAGVPLFARTVASAAGRHLTERLASELGMSLDEAERAKRLAGADGGTEPVLVAATPVVADLADEVADSLGYYEGQKHAQRVRRVYLTGGGSRLLGLLPSLGERLDVPVVLFDPFAHVELGNVGFDALDLPYLAPHLPSVIGLALGGGRSRLKGLDLVPERTASAPRDRTGLVVGGVALALASGVGMLWWQGRQAVSSAESEAAAAVQSLTAAQAQAMADGALSDPGAPAGGDPRPRILLEARLADVDWVGVNAALDQMSSPLGVSLTAFLGTAVLLPPTAVTDPATDPAVAAAASEGSSAVTDARAAAALVTVPAAAGTATGADAGSGTAAGSVMAASTGTAAGTGAEASGNGAPPAPLPAWQVGTVALTGVAPDLATIAAWLDLVAADIRFADPWVTAVIPAESAVPGAPQLLQFTAQVSVTAQNLAARPELGVAP